MDHRRNVLFVCLHGSAKSLIAAEYFNRLAAARGLGVRADSAGLDPDEAIPAPVVEGLRKDGIDVRGRRPRRASPSAIDSGTLVVAFGCDLSDLHGASSTERWDDVPAVSEDFKRARDVIVARVSRLLDSGVVPE